MTEHEEGLRFLPLIALVGAGAKIRIDYLVQTKLEDSRILGMNIDSFWQSALKDQPKEVIEHIFRGTILLEKEIGASGGSAASNISLLRFLDNRMPDYAMLALIDWTLANKGTNPYTPFGSLSSERQFREFRTELVCSGEKRLLKRFNQFRDKDYAQKKILQEKREISAQEARALRNFQKLERAQMRVQKYRELSTQRAKLLSELSKMSSQSRLLWLAETTTPLPYLVANIFDVEEKDIHMISDVHKEKLMRKLATHKGNWKQLHKKWKQFLIRLA